MGPGMERGVKRCIDDIMQDEPVGKSWWAYRKWRKKWRRREQALYHESFEGSTQVNVNWLVLHEALDRLGWK